MRGKMSRGNHKNKRPTNTKRGAKRALSKEEQIHEQELEIELIKRKEVKDNQKTQLRQTRVLNTFRITGLVSVFIILIFLLAGVVAFPILTWLLKADEALIQTILNYTQWFIGWVSLFFGFWGWLLTYKSIYSNKDANRSSQNIDVSPATSKPDSFVENDINPSSR